MDADMTEGNIIEGELITTLIDGAERTLVFFWEGGKFAISKIMGTGFPWNVLIIAAILGFVFLIYQWLEHRGTSWFTSIFISVIVVAVIVVTIFSLMGSVNIPFI